MSHASFGEHTNLQLSSEACGKNDAGYALPTDGGSEKGCSRGNPSNGSMSSSTSYTDDVHFYSIAVKSSPFVRHPSGARLHGDTDHSVLRRGEDEEEGGATGIMPLTRGDAGDETNVKKVGGEVHLKKGGKHGALRVPISCSLVSPLESAQGRKMHLMKPNAAAVRGHQQQPFSTSSALFDETAAEINSPKMSCNPAQEYQSHWSVFYPGGIEEQPPVLLHYLVLGGWRTVPGGWDYFSHRRLQKGEIVGHTVRWLHKARPRDRFVFVISPVEPKGEGETVKAWWKFWNRIFGVPPAFAYKKGKLLRQPPADCAPNSSQSPVSRTREASSLSAPRTTWVNRNTCSPSPATPICPYGKDSRGELNPSMGIQEHVEHYSQVQKGHCVSTGVEVVEIRHEDVTATDYSPRLLSSRFALEAKAVYAYYFSSMEEAFVYYDCLDDLQVVEQQIQSGVSNTFPHIFTPAQKVNSVCCGSHDSEGMFSSSIFDAATVANKTKAEKVEETVMGSFGAAFGCRNDTMFSSSTQRGTQEPKSPPAESAPLTDMVQNTTRDRISSPMPLAASHYGDMNHEGLHHFPRDDPLSPSSMPVSPASTGDSDPCDSHHSFSARDPSWVRPRVLPIPTTVHFDTIVTVYSEDPNFNAVLRELLIPEPGTHPFTASPKEQRRMLSMYETGMPAWTVFLASTGLPYRRVFRLTFVGLVNIWPIISLCVGLYDLYKHLPQMKAFLSTTLQPLLEWIDRRVTVRVSMLVTYILSVGVSVAASFTSFLGQFYVLELILTPLRLIGRLLRSPFALMLQFLWMLISIAVSFLGLMWITLKMLVVGPFVLVTHLAALDFGSSSSAVLPAAVEGTSLTMKWWRAWQEFWVTVASPVKNLAKAWYDSVVHIALSAARREASIRRWYTPKLRSAAAFMEWVWERCMLTPTLFCQLWKPGWLILLLHIALAMNCAWILFITSSDAGTVLTIEALPAIVPVEGVSVVEEGNASNLLTGAAESAVEVTSVIAHGGGNATLFFSAYAIVVPFLDEGFRTLYILWKMIVAVWAQLW